MRRKLIAPRRAYAPDHADENSLYDAPWAANICIDPTPADTLCLLPQDASSNPWLLAQKKVVFLEELSMNRRICFVRFYGKWRAILAIMSIEIKQRSLF